MCWPSFWRSASFLVELRPCTAFWPKSGRSVLDRALSVGWVSKKKKVTTTFLSLSAGLDANDKKKVVTFSSFFGIHSTIRARSKAKRPDFGQKAVLGNKPNK